MIDSTRRLLGRVVASFAMREFRWLFASSFFGILNLMTNGLTMGWLVLALTDSPFWVGAVAGIRGFGQVAFGVFAGVLIDRLDKRRVLFASQFLSGLLPFVLGLLLITEAIALWHVLVATLLQGIIFSVRAPTFNTVTYEMVGQDRILNASAAMNLGFNLARVFGAAMAGVMIDAWGIESGLFLAAGCAFVGTILLLFVKSPAKAAASASIEPFLKATAAGLKYAWINMPVRRLLSLSLVMETFGFSYNIMLPVMARDVLGVGAAELGLMSSAGGVGATLSTLAVASLGNYQRKGLLLTFNALAAGIFLVAFALSPWYLPSLVIVIFLSAALMAYDVTMKTAFHLVSADEVRGRIQSIYTLTYGFLSLGGFIAGSVATAVGAPVAIGVSGSVVVAFVALIRRSVQRMPAINEAPAAAAD